jgi:cell wall assembly regulator SMI1
MRLEEALNELVNRGFLITASNEEVVSSIEQEMDVELPDDLRYLWANFDVVDGSTFDWWHLSPVTNWRLVRESMHEVIELVGLEGLTPDDSEVVGPVKAMYWNDKWVPLFVAEHVMVCVDMDPDDGGTIGQVFFLEDDGPARVYIFSSVTETFNYILESLESGNHSIQDEDDMTPRMAATSDQIILFYPNGHLSTGRS